MSTAARASIAFDDAQRLGFGTAALMQGYGLGDAQAPNRDELLEAAVASGFRYVDTASDYQDLEQWLGSRKPYFESHPVAICTKLSAAELLSGAWEWSRSRLEGMMIDALLVHNASTEDVSNPDLVRRLIEIKSSGQVQRIGASTYGVEPARAFLQQGWCSIVQVEHSILNPSVVRSLEGVKRAGQQIVARSVLCKGLLTQRRRFAAHIPAAAVGCLERLESLAASWEFSLPELAIRFALDTPEVDRVLIGIRSLQELDVAIAAARRGPLDRKQRQSLEAFDSSRYDWPHPERWTKT